MPKQKDLKRLVRSRMKKTGESYTAARAQLIRKKAPSPSKPARPADPASVAGMSDAAVRAKTGRTWAGWVRALDAVDATGMTHAGIAARLRDDFGLPAWWAQMVAVLFEVITSPRRRGRWLPGIRLTVRKATPHKSARITWPDRTNVDISFIDKGKRSAVNIQHRKIPTREEAARLRIWWKERLDALAEVLSG